VRRLLAEQRSRATGPSPGRNRGRASRLAKIATPRSVGAALVGAAVLVWIVGNLAASPSSFAFLLFAGVTNGAIYALVALGFTLSYALIGLINLPHGFVFVTGVALCAYFFDAFGVNEGSSFAGAALAVLITLLLVMSLCGLLSAVIELVAYRPLSNAPRLARLVSAVGVLLILENVILVWTGGAPVTLPDLLPRGAVFSVMGVAYTWDKLVVLISTGFVLAGLYFGIQRTKAGRSIRAVSQDSIGAQLVGINAARTVTLGFFVSGALAGAGGELYGLYFTTVTWDHALRLTFIAFTAVVLGGIESLVGAVIGAMIIGITESFVNGFTWYSPGSDWTWSVVLSIMIMLLVLRPQGLLGTNQE
jgi:branched-chain amino acid transport system permease protein